MWEKLAQYARIQTERLLLRPLSYEDLSEFHQLVGDCDNVVFVLPVQESLSQSRQFLVEEWLKAPLGKWGLVHQGQLVGLLAFDRLDCNQKRVELRYLLAKEYRGQGLMTETLQAVAELSFEQFGYSELVLVIHLENRPSQQVAERVGFRLRRQFKGSDRESRQMRRFVEYGLTQAEWKKKEKRKADDYNKIPARN